MNNNKPVFISEWELNNLKGTEKAWHAVYEALKRGNADFMQGYGSGIQCAVREIERLQKAAVKANP